MTATTAHHPEPDRLLELAYGELEAKEAAEVKTHVETCEACATELAQIGGVRRTMAPLSETDAPVAGLESLFSYADQAAERVRRPEAPRSRQWRWWGLATLALSALLFVTVIGNVQALFGTSVTSLSGEADPEGFGAPLAMQVPAAQPADPSLSAVPKRERSLEAPEEKPHRPAAAKERRRGRRELAPPPPPPSAMLAEQEASGDLEAAPSDAAAGAPSGRGGGSVSTGLGRAVASAPPRKGRAPTSARPAPSFGGPSADASTRSAKRAPAEPSPRAPAAEAPLAMAPAPSVAEDRADLSEAKRDQAWQVPPTREEQLRQREALRAEVQAPRDEAVPESVLGRLCRLEDALGERAAADQTCARLLREYPDGPHAPFAQRRQAAREEGG